MDALGWKNPRRAARSTTALNRSEPASSWRTSFPRGFCETLATVSPTPQDPPDAGLLGRGPRLRYSQRYRRISSSLTIPRSLPVGQVTGNWLKRPLTMWRAAFSRDDLP